MKKKIKGKIKLMHDNQSIELRLFQSPRGLRFEDKRPNRVSLKFNLKNLNPIDFENLISYLINIQESMV